MARARARERDSEYIKALSLRLAGLINSKLLLAGCQVAWPLIKRCYYQSVPASIVKKDSYLPKTQQRDGINHGSSFYSFSRILPPIKRIECD